MGLLYSCFISYRRDEYHSRYIANLKELLQSEVFKVTNKSRAFLDNDSIRYAEEFDAKIFDGVSNSHFFIPIWYQNYLHLDNIWCAKELYYAIEIEKKIKEVLPKEDKNKFYFIIPFLFRGSTSNLPTCLSQKLAVNIKLLENDIANKKNTYRLTKFRQELYDVLCEYFEVFTRNFEDKDIIKLLAEIKMPDDQVIKSWVKQQKKEINDNERKKLPLLKKMAD